MIDVLIIGSGGAGLSAALSAKQNGAKVAVLSESYPTRSQTAMAQGGINAALSNVEEDSITSHFEDTLKSSAHIGSKEMIAYMCKNAQDTIYWLEKIGVPFSRTEDAKISQRRLGGATHKRACYSQDYTGLKILHTLYDQCLKEDIEFLNEKFLLNFMVENEVIKGITYLDIRSGEVGFIEAKSVIVATGGYAGIYYGFTTNTNQSTGDGIAAALRAGAKISDMEFIQFHPTALKNSSILISESARGEGGYLLNQKGERFIDELKPRDVVARAIYEQIENGNKVFLDIRHLGEEFINENLPQERKLAITYEGIDPITDLIPIKPVAHYTMGGIDVDKNLESSIKGLYAVGECSNAKIHGANRLGGNSLLEIVLCGRLAGENSYQFASQIEYQKNDLKEYENDNNFINAVFNFTNQIDFYEKKEFLGKILYRNCGIFREDLNLKAVLSAIRQMQKEFRFMGIADKGRVYNTNLVEFVKFGNTIELAEVILVNATQRCESRGAHFRVDFPKINKTFEANSVSWKEVGILYADFREIK